MGEVRTRGWLLAVVRNLVTTSSPAKPRVGIVLDRSDLLHLGRLARSTDGYENLRATGHVHRRDALVRRRPAHHVAIVTPTTGPLALAGLPVPWALAPRDGLVALPRASPSHESKTGSIRSKTGVSLSRFRPRLRGQCALDWQDRVGTPEGARPQVPPQPSVSPVRRALRA